MRLCVVFWRKSKWGKCRHDRYTTPHRRETVCHREKAEITRKSNLEKRKKRDAEHAEAKRRDEPLVIDALRAILSDVRSSPTERLYALEILDDMMGYSFIPYRLKYQDSAAVDLSRFKKELEAIQSADT